MKVSWVWVLALLVMAQGHAEAAIHTTYGYGLQTCGDWTQARKTSDWVTENVMTAWATGFLTASSRLRPAQRATDVGGIKGYLDGTCEKRPLITFETAVTALAQELGGQ